MATKTKGKSSLQETLSKFMAVGFLIVLIIFFSIASENFLTASNLTAILFAACVNGILSMGIIFALISGGNDLSIGTTMPVAAVVSAICITNWGLPIPVGIIIALLVSCVIGFVNGVLIAKLKLQAFIATLATMMITKGLALVLSGARPLYYPDAPMFEQISKGSLFSLIPGINKIPIVGTLPNAVLVLALCSVIAHVILTKTIIGRYDYAIGSNEEATRLSGVNVDMWKIILHMICSFFAGIAGIVMAARLNSAQPATGAGYEMYAIAAAVIGGVSLLGGEGGVPGTVIGAILIATLQNGLRVMSVPQEWQTVITGVIVIFAVWWDTFRRKKAA